MQDLLKGAPNKFVDMPTIYSIFNSKMCDEKVTQSNATFEQLVCFKEYFLFIN